MVTEWQSMLIKLLETEKARLEEMLSQIADDITFEWGIEVCPVCAASYEIFEKTWRHRCDICETLGVQERCYYIDRVVCVYPGSKTYFYIREEYTKELFNNYIRQIEETIEKVKEGEFD